MADNSTFSYGVGLHNVGSYRVAGDPWVSGSDAHATGDGEVKYELPWVAKRLVVHNYSDNTLRVHFNSTDNPGVTAATGAHYLEVGSATGSNSVLDLECKCKEFYVSVPAGTGRYRVYAELTGIPTGRMYALTGSGLTDYVE